LRSLVLIGAGTEPYVVVEVAVEGLAGAGERVDALVEPAKACLEDVQQLRTELGEYPAVDSTIDTHLAAMEHLIQESESLGINAELPRFVKTLSDRAVAGGRGGDGYAAMIEQFRKPAPGAAGA
jgi:hypothetical protein